MSIALEKAGRLKPEIRLGQAISEFQADLSSSQKATFRTHQLTTPPGIRDVMQLTAEINWSSGLDGRCLGSRLTNILQAVQQFAALGGVVLGATQNLLACGVWTLVRMTLLSAVKYSAYFDRLSSMLMAAGRSAPRYQLMGAIYPRSEVLRSSMLEYFIVVVQLCHHVLRLSQKSAIGQWAATLTDTLDTYQSDLELWATSIKEEVNLLTSQLLSKEAGENSIFRSYVSWSLESQSHASKIKARKRMLDACSRYDHEHDWKQIRKLGNSTLAEYSMAYTKWKEQTEAGAPGSRTLACTGKLGCGKSVLLANIVDDLNLKANKKTTVAYFFCQHDAADSLTARTVIGSLARQILDPVTDLDHASDFLERKSSLDLDHVIDLIKKLLSPDFRAYFILDGLIHCDPKDRDAILDALQELQDVMSLSLCISLRLEPSESIRELKGRLRRVTVFSIADHNPDIDSFIKAEVQRCIESGKLAVNDRLLVGEIEGSLSRGAQGMFLWVALQIKALCLQRTDAALREAIAHLPRDLSDIYRLILVRSRELGEEYQIKILELVAVACRPLTTEEMREALSVVPGEAVWSPQRLPNDIIATLACCGCLITINEEDSSVRMIHPSVRAFLEAERNGFPFDIERAKRSMAETIVTYLRYDIFSKQVSTVKGPRILVGSVTSSVISSTLGTHGRSQHLALKLTRRNKGLDRDVGPVLSGLMGSRNGTLVPLQFYHYASSWWQDHIWYLDCRETEMKALLQKLLQAKDLDRSDLRGRTPLSHASEHGHNNIVNWLLVQGAQETSDFLGRTPLHWAVEARHLSVVKSLLDSKRFNPDAKDHSGLTPTVLAVKAKDFAVLKYLLQSSGTKHKYRNYSGEDLLTLAVAHNFKDGVKLILSRINEDQHNLYFEKQMPLHDAAKLGNADAIGELLASKTMVSYLNAQNSDGNTPLWLAAAHGHENAVRALCACSSPYVDHNQVSRHGESPFWIAAARGHQNVVDYLSRIETVNVNLCNRLGVSPLQIAAKNGHASVVRQLLHVERVSGYYETKTGQSLLWLAASEGHEDVVEMLIASGRFDVNHPNHSGVSPLWIAASRGHDGVTRLLATEKSIELNFRDAAGRSALWIAASHGHGHVVEALIATNSVDLNSRDAAGVSPLWIAASSGRVDVVKTLMAVPGVALNCRDRTGTTPLWVAASKGHSAIVRIMVSLREVDVNCQAFASVTPLWIAASNGHMGVVRILTSHSLVDLDRPDARGRTPLSIAAFKGHEAIVRLLIFEGGVDQNRPDNKGVTPLWAAASGSEAAIVRLLVSDTNVNCRSHTGRTPLWIAASRCHTEVVKTLLNCPCIDLNASDEDGETPFYTAAKKGHEEVVEILMQNENVKVDHTAGEADLTPFLAAVKGNHLRVVKALLNCSRVVESTSASEMWRSLEMAKTGGFDGLANILQEYISTRRK